MAAAVPSAPTAERMAYLNAKPVLTVAELAELTGRSIPTIYRWLDSGALRSVRHSKEKLVARVEFDRFLVDGEVAA